LPTEKAEPFGARHIFSRDGLIIMQDLASLGFRMVDRQVGLDLAHCLIVVRRLATFHAASVILYQQDPECMAPFLRSLLTEPVNQKQLTQMFSGVCFCQPEEICTNILRCVSVNQKQFAQMSSGVCRCANLIAYRSFLTVVSAISVPPFHHHSNVLERLSLSSCEPLYATNTYLLTCGAEPFLRSRQLCSPSRTPRHFMEPEGSIKCSQEPSTCPYPKPYESNPLHRILSL
jgi:hypothetical protein